MALRLAGKTALVTGVAEFGAQITAVLTAEGASVVVADASDEAAGTLASRLNDTGLQAVPAAFDVTDLAGWTAAVKLAQQTFGGLDILVNAATVVSRDQLLQTTRSDWETALAVNLTAPLLGMQAAAPAMATRGGGSIVLIGTTAAIVGSAPTAYTTSKWGLRGLAKSAALALAPDRIRVNCLHLGSIGFAPYNAPSPIGQAKRHLTPLGRGVDGDEIGQAVTFLASDESKFITGVDLPLDGGFSELGQYQHMWSATT